MTRQRIKFFISMQYRYIGANCHCHYEAINQFSHLISSAATDSKQHSRIFIVNRLSRKHGCCINQYENLRLLRISSRSPVHPNPRKRRASSKLSGSIASERSAEFTASRFVEKRNRFMTAAQAFSSTSMFVRAIQILHTTGGRRVRVLDFRAEKITNRVMQYFGLTIQELESHSNKIRFIDQMCGWLAVYPFIVVKGSRCQGTAFC